jgi:chromosome segregation ATPase
MRNSSLKAGLAFFAALLFCVAPAFAQVKKDYLSSTEADKIREAYEPNERIKLFLSFASDRLKQLQYELDHPSNNVRRTDRLNGLLIAFSGCLDEAVDRMELGVEKQEDVREAIKAVQSQSADFLAYLKNLAAKGPERNTYKENLDDALASAQDAIRSAEDSSKDGTAPAPPVRRRPQ